MVVLQLGMVRERGRGPGREAWKEGLRPREWASHLYGSSAAQRGDCFSLLLLLRGEKKG